MVPTIALGSLSLRTWGLVVAGGVLLCWALLLWRAGRLGYSRRGVFAWVLLALPVGGLSGRALATLVNAMMGEAASGGMTVLGSVAGCLAFSALFVPRVLGTRVAPLLDAAAFTYPLSLGIGRLGCLLNGCCLGRPAPASAPRLATIPAALVGHAARGHLWNLPALLGLNALLALVATEWLYRRRERLGLRDGSVACATLLVESAGRFPLEFLRDDPVSGPLGLNPWQALVFVVAVVSGLELWRRNAASRA
ncbi:MAG: prolipoprotein diacylglyceryl transferase [Deltaproteobacteria bacterium]|nr:prolipoprotein diacylglyceryl transferase [Deltaproteobacteria bacterium]